MRTLFKQPMFAFMLIQLLEDQFNKEKETMSKIIEMIEDTEPDEWEIRKAVAQLILQRRIGEHQLPKPTMEEELIELAGERCDEFVPGCACCDAWEMWDLHAYWALQAELKEVRDWCEEN